MTSGEQVFRQLQRIARSDAAGFGRHSPTSAPETTVAEKGVTILERGITSTRWRDFVDIVQLAEQHGIDATISSSAHVR